MRRPDHRNLAKLARRLNWLRPAVPHGATPRFYLFTDTRRLADPVTILSRLPRGAAVVLRHTDEHALERLARRTVPRAHALGLWVVLSGTVRQALAWNCDGVHLSETRARRGPPRIACPPGFLVTAAAHGPVGLVAARRAGADVVILSPVFPTSSHPGRPALGAVRFARMARLARTPVVALGGLTPDGARRLRLGPAYGLAAIGAWSDGAPD